MTTPILFLSGAGLPAWIWDEARALLNQESRVAVRPGPDATLTAYAAAALESADGWDSFTVVAHSAGGVVGSELLALAPERVVGFVGVSACLPGPGRSFLGALPIAQRHVVSLLMRMLGTRPPASQIRELGRGTTAEQTERIIEEFQPESQRLYRDRLSPHRFPESSAFLLTARDTQVSAALEEKYAARLGGATETLDTEHLPMLEDPAALVGAITGVLRAQPS